MKSIDGLTNPQVDKLSTARIGSSTRLTRAVLRHEGGLRALYRGLTPNLLGNSASWALYFSLYSKTKSGFSAFHGDTSPLSYWDYFFASGVAGDQKVQ